MSHKLESKPNNCERKILGVLDKIIDENIKNRQRLIHSVSGVVINNVISKCTNKLEIKNGLNIFFEILNVFIII
jgi:hypothetical protein